MATPRKSVADHHGHAAGYKFVFRSSDPETIATEIKDLKASHAYPGIRNMVLTSLGLQEQPNPEYMIITGCVRVFDSTQRLGNYFNLLDRLGIRYTFLRTSEYCSNLPGLHTADTEESWEAAWQDARELCERNLEQARPLGVRHLVYFCSDGYAVAQRIYQRFGLEMEPLFYLDILCDRLDGQNLRLPPTRVGFYPGCWRERRLVNPKVKIRPKDWREMLERIAGVEIVPLSAEKCCKEEPEAIMRQAEELKVDRIVTPCNGVGQSKFKNLGRIPASTIADLIFEALPPQ